MPAPAQVVSEEMLKALGSDSVLVADHAEGFRQVHRLQAGCAAA